MFVVIISWYYTSCISSHSSVNFGGETDFRVVVGEHNRDVDEGTERLIGVSHVIIHESYNKSNTDNDIALLKLSRNITFTRNVKPICLPRDDVEENTMCITTGWGDTRGKITFNTSNYPMSTVSTTVCMNCYTEWEDTCGKKTLTLMWRHGDRGDQRWTAVISGTFWWGFWSNIRLFTIASGRDIHKRTGTHTHLNVS